MILIVLLRERSCTRSSRIFDGANFFPKMWRGGAKIMWRGAAVALMRWRENFSWNNGAVVRWRKGFKSGARRGGAN